VTHPKFRRCTGCCLGGVVLLFCLAPAGGRGEEETPQVRLEAPFYLQAKWGNDAYIHQHITESLAALDAVDKQLAPEPKILANHLDLGETQASEIARRVGEIIALQKKHNGRLARWAGDDSAIRPLLQPLYMTARQVAERRERFPQWPYHPVLWFVEGVKAGWIDHEIPRDGLKFELSECVRSATPYLKKFAFLYFLRKLCQDDARTAKALENVTGSLSGWDAPSQTLDFTRWKYVAYRYSWIVPSSKASDAPPLRAFAIEECLWEPKRGNLQEFYDNKLRWLADLAREMERKPSLAVGAEPYLSFYGFLGRWCPIASSS